MTKNLQTKLPSSKKEMISAPQETINYLISLSKQIIKSKKSGYTLESFMIASYCIESLLLPMLINYVCSMLKIDKQKSKFSDLKFYHLNLTYLALSQDLDLYTELEKFRVIRNKIVHNLNTFKNLEKAKEEAKVSTRLFAQIFFDIMDRFEGKVAIPVLTYYAKGWNDMRDKTLSILKSELIG